MASYETETLPHPNKNSKGDGVSPVPANCPPTQVKGDYSFGFVRPSVDTILSPQLLRQFSRDFDDTFQVLLLAPEDDHILSRPCSADFYQKYGLFAIFQQ